MEIDEARQQALSHLLGVARGFQHRDMIDVQTQADLMAEAVAVYDRVDRATDPVDAEAALAPIVLDEILERGGDGDDDDELD